MNFPGALEIQENFANRLCIVLLEESKNGQTP